MMLIAAPLVGCSSEDDLGEAFATKAENTDQSKLTSGLESALGELFSRTDGDFANGGYIVYSAKDAQFYVMSEREYTIVTAMETTMASGDKTIDIKSSSIQKAPSGKGWTVVGYCSKSGYVTDAFKISRLIPAGKDFKLHAELQKDGTNNVWYRIV